MSDIYPSKMSGQSEGDGDTSEITVFIPTANVKQEEKDGQLLVAMQPGVEIPAIGVEEVVIVTEGDTDGVVGHVELETTIDGSTQHTGILEISQEIPETEVKPFAIRRAPDTYGYDESGTYARRSMVYERQGIQASKLPPPESSGESDSDESSSDPHMMYPHSPSKKTPKKRDFAYRLQWRSKDMLDAMRAVEDKKMTIRGAAKKYLVPYSTLKDRIHGRVRHGTKPGVKTALSPEEEDELVRYIKDMEAAGFLMRNADLRERAGELLRLNYGHSSPYGEGCSPGHNWLSGFLKRHNGIEFKRQSARAVVPSCSRQKQLIKKFYDVTGQVYKKNRLATKPERVYVVSEMKMAVFQKATIIYSASAAGTSVPPFVIFKGQQKLKLTSAREAYPQAFFTSSPHGVVTEEIFLWWFRDHFLKSIPHSGNRPLVLFISQPCINVSLQMYQLAKEERVIFISIPQGVTHLLQPLDDELGEYVEGCLSKKVKKWESLNSGSIFNQKILAQLLQKVWRKVFTVDEISNKYSKVGIYPLNPSAISTDKILAMSHAMRENMRQTAGDEPADQNDEDDALQGLSLLSALSSHEYASISRNNSQGNIQEDLDRSYDHEEETSSSSRLLEEFYTPSGPAVKRLRLDDESTDLFDRDMEPVMEEVVQRVTQERSKTGKVRSQAKKDIAILRPATKTEKEHVDVQSEIAMARENLDQINRAVDSILAEELTSPSTSRPTPRMSPRRPMRSPRHTPEAAKIDRSKMKVVRPAVKVNSRTSISPAVITQKKSANILNRSTPTSQSTRLIPKAVQRVTPKAAPKVTPKAAAKVVHRPTTRVENRATKKIVFLVNKDGQLISQSDSDDFSPHMDGAGDAGVAITTQAVEEVIEEPVQDFVYTNIKMEEQNGSQVTVLEEQTVIENPQETTEQVIYTTTDNTFVTTGTSDMDTGYTISHSVDEQPPQNILQDDELDLETVDTILINGQLFRVIRPDKNVQAPVVKHENVVETDALYEDGGRASVVHQEVVQDYEVSSFEHVTIDPSSQVDNVIGEQVV